MTKAPAAEMTRLATITSRLIELHQELPLAEQAYFEARHTSIRAHIEAGASVTAARDAADHDTIVLRGLYLSMQGDIAALIEERDHLRFVVDHLT